LTVITCTGTPASAMVQLASVAQSVLPSPVRISATAPRSMAKAPSNCTS